MFMLFYSGSVFVLVFWNELGFSCDKIKDSFRRTSHSFYDKNIHSEMIEIKTNFRIFKNKFQSTIIFFILYH